MKQKDIGNFLAKLRKTYGLTQEELSEYLHVTHQAVSKWETGNGIPDILTMIEISNLYKVPLSDILSGKKSEGTEENITDVKGYVRKKINSRKNEQKFPYIYLLIVSLCLVLFVVFLLNYKNNYVYSLTYSDDNIELFDSKLYVNNDSITWKVGTITYHNEAILDNNANIVLSYVNGSKDIELISFSGNEQNLFCNSKECNNIKKYILKGKLKVKIYFEINGDFLEFSFNPQVIKINDSSTEYIGSKNLNINNLFNNKSCLQNNGYHNYDNNTLMKEITGKIKFNIYINKNNYFFKTKYSRIELYYDGKNIWYYLDENYNDRYKISIDNNEYKCLSENCPNQNNVALLYETIDFKAREEIANLSSCNTE